MTDAVFVILTQGLENYARHDKDTGHYWKFKPGSIIIADSPEPTPQLNERDILGMAYEMISQTKDAVFHAPNGNFNEWIVGVYVVDPNWLAIVDHCEQQPHQDYIGCSWTDLTKDKLFPKPDLISMKVLVTDFKMESDDPTKYPLNRIAYKCVQFTHSYNRFLEA